MDDAIRHRTAQVVPGQALAAHVTVILTRGVDPATGQLVGQRLCIWSDGCDPHMRLGLLDAEAETLRQQILRDLGLGRSA